MKKYEEKEWLENQMKSGSTPKQIANMCNVSYKLINVWMIKHGLIVRTPETKVP
jgi:hypothetical protein